VLRSQLSTEELETLLAGAPLRTEVISEEDISPPVIPDAVITGEASRDEDVNAKAPEPDNAAEDKGVQVAPAETVPEDA
jgi:hypothetical protein